MPILTNNFPEQELVEQLTKPQLALACMLSEQFNIIGNEIFVAATEHGSLFICPLRTKFKNKPLRLNANQLIILGEYSQQIRWIECRCDLISVGIE